VLREQRDLPGAVASFKKATDLEPKGAGYWYNLGKALGEQQDLDGAITAYKKAINLAPSDAEAHCNLGHVLRKQGKFAEALESLQLGHKLGRQRPGWPYPSARWVIDCARLLKLEQRLNTVLTGKAQAKGPAEHLLLADFCVRFRKRYADAVRLYQAAFVQDPALADKRPFARSQAACAAALAAGTSLAPPHLDDQARAQLRRQALDWLKAELDGIRRLVAGSPEKEPASPLEKLARPGLPGTPGNGTRAVELIGALDKLAHWQQNPDLAGVREAKELARLPAEEQKAWRALWADVAALHKQASAHFRETQYRGHLTDQQRDQMHDVQLQAGKTYVFDLESKDFDPELRLEDETGQKLAENNDIAPGVIQNSQIIITAVKDGRYRLVATAFQGRGTGAYLLRVREFVAKR
jgi:hypothetical protein